MDNERLKRLKPVKRLKPEDLIDPRMSEIIRTSREQIAQIGRLPTEGNPVYLHSISNVVEALEELKEKINTIIDVLNARL